MPPCRRCPGPGRARPGVFVPGARALELAPGDIVSVPLGAREATAVVWAENPKPNPRLDNRLKDVEEKLELPPLKPELRSFVDWVANYTIASRGMVLRMCLRMGEHLGAERERVGVRLVGPASAAHDHGPAAGAVASCRQHAAQQRRCRPRSRRQQRRDRWPDRRGYAGNGGAAAGAGRGTARSRFRAAGSDPGPECGRSRTQGHGRQGRLFGHACSTASPARARPRSISRRWPM